MTNNALRTAVLAVALAISSQALARAPAPLVPTALVEDVKSASADVEFMDYVGTGQVIKLEPSDVLVLSYLKSCEHETITGGTVRVGRDKSDVDGGKIARAKVPCNGGNMKLTSQQANASAASSFRLMITHGYSDMVTPYAASRYVLDHLPNIGDPARAQLKLYRGGHMYYIDPQSRKAFSKDAKTFYQEP